MKRKFWHVLEKWSANPSRMPLVVMGARQTGKTYIIDKYCSENYKNYVYINLFKDKNIIEIYEKYANFDIRLEFIKEKYNIDFNDKNTILFIDEVQVCEELIESLKLFCEAGITNIICAGSLLGVKVKRFKKSYPVGKVQEENLYPMDFEEFLIATNNEKYIEIIKKSFKNNQECIFHDDLMFLFKRYLYLGGMPAVLQDYLDSGQDLSKINNSIIPTIISDYTKDMAKYTKDEKESLRIEAIYNNIAPQLLKENPKFMYAKFDKKSRKADYISALDWLVASKLVLMCNQLETVKYPIKLYQDNDNYKLFLNDVGILRNVIGIKVDDLFFEGDYSYKGLLAENYVATELMNQFGMLHYWSKKGNENNSKAEVDFVIQVGTKIVPIEVKAGEKIKSKSLDLYNKQFNPEFRIRVSAKNFGMENGIKSIPLYATFLIKELINETE